MSHRAVRLSIFLTAALALALTLSSPATGAATAAPQDQKPAGKYADFCGDYRFDLSVLGIGEMTAKVSAENDLLYIQSSTSSDPDLMSPVEGQPTKFFIDDPDEGHWDFEFIKDDSGRFSKLRIINATLGVDSVGERIRA